MGYLKEVDQWLDVIFADLANGKTSYHDVKRDIRERILDSYRNGVEDGERKAPPRGRDQRRRSTQPLPR